MSLSSPSTWRPPARTVSNMAHQGRPLLAHRTHACLCLVCPCLLAESSVAPPASLLAAASMPRTLLTHATAGELSIGKMDPSKYTGSVQYVPLSSETYYEVALNDMSINGKPITATTSAILDTGTSLLTLPTADVKAFMASIGATPFLNGESAVRTRQGPALIALRCCTPWMHSICPSCFVARAPPHSETAVALSVCLTFPLQASTPSTAPRCPRCPLCPSPSAPPPSP